jgi:hypothetical protein
MPFIELLDESTWHRRERCGRDDAVPSQANRQRSNTKASMLTKSWLAQFEVSSLNLLRHKTVEFSIPQTRSVIKL